MDMDGGQPGEVKLQELYGTYRGLLFGLAYRMTGSAADAEDLVQDVFVQLRHVRPEPIRSMKAYLCRMLTNRCLDHLKSARVRRERYVGQWLPEPLPDPEPASADRDPGEICIRKEAVTYAVLALLERLNPVERAVFVLREAFGFDYPDIAAILGKSEANCRKLLSRVKPKLGAAEAAGTAAATGAAGAAEASPAAACGEPTPPGPPAAAAPGSAAEAFAGAFLEAATTGRMDGLIRLLAEDAILYSDGGGKVRSAIRPIYGRARVLAFLAGLYRKSAALGLPVAVSTARFNGEEGLLLQAGSQLIGTVAFQVREDGQAAAVFMQRNPDKLVRFAGSSPD